MSTGGKGGGWPIWRFVWTSWKLNLASAMEYRVSFLLTAGMMFLNNFVWILFWGLFFHRFPVVNGWGLTDVMMLWAVSAGGFGWMAMLFGNASRIATIVVSGQLDVYLSQPKPVLLHVLVSRMSMTAIGDFAFGLVIYAFVGDHSWGGAARFALGLALSGAIFLFFFVTVHSLAFFIGNAEGLGAQLFQVMVALTTYPTDIFRGIARLVLFTIIPAGFISYMPLGLLKAGMPAFLWGAVGAAAGFGAAAIALFALGLRRYSSGNLTVMRG